MRLTQQTDYRTLALQSCIDPRESQMVHPFPRSRVDFVYLHPSSHEDSNAHVRTAGTARPLRDRPLLGNGISMRRMVSKARTVPETCHHQLRNRHRTDVLVLSSSCGLYWPAWSPWDEWVCHTHTFEDHPWTLFKQQLTQLWYRWQWLFIIDGVISVGVIIPQVFFFPDVPARQKPDFVFTEKVRFSSPNHFPIVPTSDVVRRKLNSRVTAIQKRAESSKVHLP